MPHQHSAPTILPPRQTILPVDGAVVVGAAAVGGVAVGGPVRERRGSQRLDFLFHTGLFEGQRHVLYFASQTLPLVHCVPVTVPGCGWWKLGTQITPFHVGVPDGQRQLLRFGSQ